jgi:hypothetical protein
MAVDSLMFGVTDNITELTKLATGFLPPQVANANAHGFVPTVYAAEALGLGLAGGNGTSNAFATNFGSLSASDFASAVSNLTGINSGAIQNFVQNWINFYTANPAATFGLSVTLASYGAAFGDAVGAALLNSTVNASLALLTSEVQNALIDNAEGRYLAGIPLILEPAHVPLQGEAFLIPNAGKLPLGPTIDAATQFGTNYAEFVAPKQSDTLVITNAPNIFTLNTQHFAALPIGVFPVGAGELFTVILGDSTAGESVGAIEGVGYATMSVVVNGTNSAAAIGPNDQLVVSGSGSLDVAVMIANTITDYGVPLTIEAVPTAKKIDASNAPVLVMNGYCELVGTGLTVLGGTDPFNILHGSLGTPSKVTFSNGSTGVASVAGADHLTAGGSGDDTLYVDGGGDTIILPNHARFDTVIFGQEPSLLSVLSDVLAITDGTDTAYPGSWGVAATATAIPNLFSGNTTGGTSADMTAITGFNAELGDLLEFKAAAWNGESNFLGIAAAQGDLAALNGVTIVPTGAAQLSAVWHDSTSNSSLKPFDSVLLYAPSDTVVANAQELAARLHTVADAIVLPSAGSSTLGFIEPGQAKHILVAYVHLQALDIADVDLVNTSASNQNSTANLNVYALDLVSLTGVSLTSLTSANIQFI